MKIALYYPWIYLKSGVERTILEIVKHSSHDWTIFTSHYDRENTYPEFKDLNVIELKRVPVERGYLSVLKAAVTIMAQKIDLSGFDALMINSEGLGDFITFRNHSLPVLCFCHTPLKVIHDPFMRLSYLEKNPHKIIPFLIFSSIFNLFDRRAWQNYKLVVAISDEVKKRILKARLAPEKKIEVLRGGVDTKKIVPTWNYERYFFHPGRIKWYKNIELSIEGFKLFSRDNPGLDFELIIAGHLDKRSESYLNYLKKLSNINPKIKIIANPDEATFKKLYQNCYTVLSTTPNEDLGLTPLEAAAYGKPVIAIDQGGPKETVLNGETGFLLKPVPNEFSKILALLACDKELVLRIGKKAKDHSIKFDWDVLVGKLDLIISDNM